jgi:hypothetical protein
MDRELITLIVALLPAIISSRGSGGVWKFLSLLFCGMAAWSGLTGGFTVVTITLWVIAWIFAGIALQGRRRKDDEPIIAREVSDPGPGLFEPDGVHAGIPYRVNRDGSVEAIMQGATVRFADHAKFSVATGAPPLRDILPPQLPAEKDATPIRGVLARLERSQSAAIAIAAALVISLGTLSILKEEEGFLVLGFVLACVALCVGLALLISKKRRALGKTLTLVSTVAAVLVLITFGVMIDRFAQKEGFLNSADRSAARAQGYKTGADWGAVRNSAARQKH